MKRAPLPCPACGQPMNRHAEKLLVLETREEAASFDTALGGVIEEHYLCAACRRIEVRRAGA